MPRGDRPGPSERHAATSFPTFGSGAGLAPETVAALPHDGYTGRQSYLTRGRRPGIEEAGRCGASGVRVSRWRSAAGPGALQIVAVVAVIAGAVGVAISWLLSQIMGFTYDFAELENRARATA